MWKRLTLVVVIACGATLTARTQRTEQPPLIGPPGGTPPLLIFHVSPTYPQIAQSARVTGKVMLQATLAPNGVVTNVSVTRSVPLLDQASIEAVRQWRFAPPTIDGRPATVIVPVTLAFEIQPRLAPVQPRPERITSVPPDFDVVYEGRCSPPNNGRFLIDTSAGTYSYTYSPAVAQITVLVRFGLRPTDFAAMHRSVVDSRLLSERTDLRRWAEPQSEPVILQDRIELTVVAQEPTVDVQSSEGPSTGWYIIDVRANGIWARLWPPQSVTPATDLEPIVRRVRRTIEARINDATDVRRLPREQQLCPWRD